VSAHKQLGGVVLSKQEQQLRKASQVAEASLVCGKAEINAKTNEASDVNGVQEIRWQDIQKPASAGLVDINKESDSEGGHRRA